ncbi:DUF4097 family beta strand repeat-containing protein [Runella limosa]|uniref:DUF4097 family beta strand repeat-containing protein n=1 Tax=Runella limosa TaxID=370978 RepID=UPI0003F664E1|nr:DUF4097 family beta strand repeat-containing protein [Runella limosa]
MKQIILPLLVGVVLSCAHSSAQNQEFKEHTTKEFTLPQNAASSTLTIYNISGSIKVEGYSGDKVIIDVDKTISGKTSEILEQGKAEFKFVLEQKADTVMAYIIEPFDSRPNRSWNDRNNNRHIEYRYNLDFKVKVPYSMNLHVSTVNGGDVLVSDVTGMLEVGNVNGAITLKNVKGATKLRTVNGNVDANYTAIPPGQSSYKTLNGDIRISYPAALSADCEFKSFRGEFYTDFDNVETLPVKVVKNQEQRGDKTTVYKLNTETSVRIGNGGKLFRFETFNGNIYIKKQS